MVSTTDITCVCGRYPRVRYVHPRVIGHPGVGLVVFMFHKVRMYAYVFIVTRNVEVSV